MLSIVYIPVGLYVTVIVLVFPTLAFPTLAFPIDLSFMWSFYVIVLVVIPLGSFSLSYWLRFKKQRYWLALLVVLPAVAIILALPMLLLQA